MGLKELMDEYKRFYDNQSSLHEGSDIVEIKDLLLKFRNAGRYIVNDQDREILSAWCRNIGDVIYKNTSEYPAVIISPFNAEEAINVARATYDLKEQVENLVLIARHLPLEKRCSIYEESLYIARSILDEADRKDALETIKTNLSEKERLILFKDNYDETENLGRVSELNFDKSYEPQLLSTEADSLYNKFNSAERHLIDAISRDDLRNSIKELRDAAEKILTPSIQLQDYTVNDIEHSKRIAQNVIHLLRMNERVLLSDEEKYLLLAGIYLHDIGMMCDITESPEIKLKAEEMGAKFEAEVKTSNINEYKEKRDIRDNHQYLSAAWISYAIRSHKTSLANAASKIPAYLVSDLLEICKYHSKLPINNCIVASRNYPAIRVQFISAILRFADELDTDRKRASFSSINLHGLDPYNAVYWWLRNSAIIAFEPANVLILKIMLNRADYPRYSSVIYNQFIAEFQTKNHPIITILRQNGIPIAISSESGVIEDQNAADLPEDIKLELNRLDNPSDQADVLAYEVRTWLRALSYETYDMKHIDEKIIEMKASADPGVSDQKVLVACYDRELKIFDIDEISNKINMETPIGMLITNKIISLKVSDYAYSKRNIQIFYINDFLQQRVWANYFNSLRYDIEKDSIQKLYIDLGCYQEDISNDSITINKFPSLDNFIDRWLKEPGKAHISLLGDFGTGKTWFCRHYAYRQLMNYLKDPINERMPLLITLREFSKATTAKQLINDALIEQYKLPFKGSAFDIFKDLNRRGKLLLILDGFDEMARKVDYQTVIDNFWELAELTDNNSKVILTSRTEYFRLAKESEKILGGETYGRSTIELSPHKFEILHIDRLSNKQIRDLIFLRRRGMKEGESDVDLILSRNDLSEMARKPVLIEYLLAALDEIGTNKDNIPQNISQVYLYATNKLILRNIESKRTFTSTADKLYFLCELSWEMIKNNNHRIHFSEIPDVITKYFGDKIKGKGELDNWDFDLRNQTLLHRDAKGYYEFAHKSLAEFFVAFKFISELGCLSQRFTQTYLENDLKPTRIPYKLKNITDLAKTFGALSLLDATLAAVREFLMKMIAEDAPGTLWRILDESNHEPLNKAKYCGGNATIMLQDMGIWKPTSYRDTADLLKLMLIPQEYIIPPSPAKRDKFEKALSTLGYNIKTGKSKRKKMDEPLNLALSADNLLKEGKLKEAFDIVESSRINNSKLKEFYIPLVAYAGIQSLYLGNFKEAELYFMNFEKAGGNKYWSRLKINEVLLYGISHMGKTDIELTFKLRDDAEKLLQNSIEIGDTSIEARSLLFLGILARFEHRYDESIDKLRKAKELFIRERDISKVGVSSANIGFTFNLMCRYEEAISNYDVAIKTFEQSNDKYMLAFSKALRGSTYRALKLFNEAIDDYDAAISIFQDLDELRKAVILKELGTTYLILGRWNEAIKNYRYALEYFNKTDIIHGNILISQKGQTLYNLGLAYLIQTKWGGSLEYFRKALIILQERQDSYNMSLALSSIGIALRMMNFYPAALEHLNKALEIVINEVGDKNRECLLIIQISEIYLKMLNYDQALSQYNRALEIAGELKDYRLKGNILGRIGVTHRLMNNLEDAEPNFKQSLQIFMDMRDIAKISWMLEELSQVYINQGFYDKAIQEYNNALKYLSSSDRALMDDNLVNLVEGYVLQVIPTGKINKYKAVLSEIEKLGALGLRCKMLRSLGEAYRRSAKYDDAIAYLNKSLEIARIIKDKTQEGKTLCYLGLAYANLAQSSRGADSIAYNISSILRLEEALKIFRNLEDNFHESWTLETLGKVHLMRSSWNEALENYKRALDLEPVNSSGFIYLGLATCYKNMSAIDLYKNECQIAHKRLSVEGMNEFSLACLEAICGSSEKSIRLLEIALNKGQASIEQILQDPYLKDIRSNPNYERLQSKLYKDMQMIPFL